MAKLYVFLVLEVLALASKVILALPRIPHSSQGCHHHHPHHPGIDFASQHPWKHPWKFHHHHHHPWNWHEHGGPETHKSNDEKTPDSSFQPQSPVPQQPVPHPTVLQPPVPQTPVAQTQVPQSPVPQKPIPQPPVPTTQKVATESQDRKRPFLVMCIKRCKISIEFKPVCGSNGVSYPNPGLLECERNCGIDVTLVDMDVCSPLFDPVEATTAEKVLHTNMTDICMIYSCPVTGEFNPVCGTNNVTYANPGHLECAQSCGVQVQLSRKTDCEDPLTEEEGRKDIATTVTETTFDATPKNSKGEEAEVKQNEGISCNEGTRNSPSLVEVLECMRTCTLSLTLELNPVCGSDSVTYVNPGRLLCAQFCGIDVKVKHFSACQNDTTNGSITSATEALSVTTAPDENISTIDPLILFDWTELMTEDDDDDKYYGIDLRARDKKERDFDRNKNM